jgi:phosphoglycerate dehydrogenase-like enzyme
VLRSPHNSGIVPEAISNATRDAVENIKRFLQGLTIKGIIKKEEYL